MDIVSFTGRRCLTIKEEAKSLVQPPRKRKAYSTTDASSIGCIKILGSDIDTAQPSGSTTSPPLALSKCDSMVSWCLPVLPVLPPGQRGNQHILPRSMRRRICVSCLSVLDRLTRQQQRPTRQLQRFARTFLSSSINFMHYFYVPTLQIKPSASSVR
jgi:hypothetical protein